MIHRFSLHGVNFILDVNSGGVHIADGAAYDLSGLLRPPLDPLCPGEVYAALPQYGKAEIDEAYRELFGLFTEGLLFSGDDEYRGISLSGGEDAPVKALCLHVSHDCNLRCGYCFAHTGDFGGERAVMDADTARAAIDFAAENSGSRRNIEIDFFGGEPLMGRPAIAAAIDYARQNEEKWGKRFRFTLTTNGMLIDDEVIDLCDREISNVVLSLDGRKEINDAQRVDLAGRGSFDRVYPRLKRLADSRRGRDYFVRGTFTRKNLDFAEDVAELYRLGFRNISVEPVVTDDPELAITPEMLPAVFDEYDRLALWLAEQRGKGENPTFFHFQIDLRQGPCAVKRMKGCGAGCEYMAVTPSGELYPCHQFVGRREFLIGSLGEGIKNRDVRRRFGGLNIVNNPDCKDCWARFYCSGGCAAANYGSGGGLDCSYKLGCEMEKKRIECALYLCAEGEEE